MRTESRSAISSQKPSFLRHVAGDFRSEEYGRHRRRERHVTDDTTHDGAPPYDLFEVVGKTYNGVQIIHDEPSGISNTLVVNVTTTTVISGWLLVNGPGAYLKALATRLGERHAEDVAPKVRNLLLKSRGSRKRQLLMAFDPDAENIRFEIQCDQATDAAWLALLDLVSTSAELGGAVLVWNAEAGQWVRREPT
jgi:hypothetical protein